MYSQTIKRYIKCNWNKRKSTNWLWISCWTSQLEINSKFTMQSLQNLLRNSYIKIPAGSITQNIAAVMVTADLPPFSRQGIKFIKVSTIGDANQLIMVNF